MRIQPSHYAGKAFAMPHRVKWILWRFLARLYLYRHSIKRGAKRRKNAVSVRLTRFCDMAAHCARRRIASTRHAIGRPDAAAHVPPRSKPPETGSGRARGTAVLGDAPGMRRPGHLVPDRVAR